jgi:GNAT superfamily N-acetyltransferase
MAWGDEDLVAATGKGLYVHPDWRGRGLAQRMNAAFMNQQHVDLMISTTTNALAGKLFRKMGLLTIPQPGYDTALYWVVRPAGFVGAALKRKGLPAVVAGPAGVTLAQLLHAENLLRGRGSQARGFPKNVEVLRVDEIGPEFDDLWKRKRAEGKRLMGCRSSDFMRWHFQQDSHRRVTRILCCRSGGRLTGYLNVERQLVRDIGLRRARIVDVFVERDDSEIVDRLLAAVYAYAKESGCHVVEMVGFPRAIRDRFLAGRPHARLLPSWPYFYLPMKKGLARELEHEESWYACPYDGDASLFSRGE